MFYGVYRDMRDSSWRCLLDFAVMSLPVDVLSMAKRADVHVIRNSLLGELAPNEQGKAFFDGKGWIIIYDDTQPVSVSRFTVAHELGHIFLGHRLKCADLGGALEFESVKKSEMHADMFAERILCPACVLWALDLQSADEIADFCNVPVEVADKRARRMRLLRRRNVFLTDPLEKRVFINFGFENAREKE